MTVLNLPSDFETWAANEVAWGRASDVEAVARAAFDDFRRRRDEAQLEAFRETLDEARRQLDEGLGLPAEQVFAELQSKPDERHRA